MADATPIPDDDGLQQAIEIAETEEGHVRRPDNWQRWLVPAVAVIWSLFQLAIAWFVEMDAIKVRCVHLGLALLIVFFEVPFFKKWRKGPGFLHARDRIPWVDLVLGVTAALAAVYLWIDYAQIVDRLGAPTTRDLVVGGILIVLLLEGARRIIGPALSVVAIVFTLMAFFGESLPSFLAVRDVSFSRYIGQITLMDRGIYGIPLDVSAKVVFLFVLLGAMLDKAGGGRFFIQMALCLLGTLRGGPAKAAVLASGLTGMISGSSIANIVTTGTFTIPLMKKVGYPRTKAAAIEVAASTDGQLAPPIMGAAAFIMAERIAGVQYIDVIKAAAVPAFASYAALFYITHLEACKLGLKGMPREELPKMREVLARGWYFLIPIAVLLYHLILRQHSPELSAFHAVWVMAIVMVLQDVLPAWRAKTSQKEAWLTALADIAAGLISGARCMVPVALATAAAGIIVGVVDLGLAGKITSVIDTLSGGNILLMLIITAIVSLIIGMGLPTTATYIVVATLVAPAIVDIGAANGFVVPALAAHLFCFYFGILADDTPPVGLAAYAASAIAKSPPVATGVQAFTYDIRTAILPFMFIFNTELILHGVNGWAHGLFIFAMACIANFAFAAATQGWFATRNRWYHVPFLVGVALIMFRPEMIADWCQVDFAYRYWFYALGVGMFVAIYMWQKVTAEEPELPPVQA